MGEANAPASLTPGAERLVQAARENLRLGDQQALGAHHWLLALVERHGPMAEAMATGLQAAALQRDLRKRLQEGDSGDPLSEESTVGQALSRARERGRSQASERDLASVVLTVTGYQLTESPPARRPGRAGEGNLQPSPVPVFHPRMKAPVPTLEQFGRDLTYEARAGRLSPVIGREQEVQLVIETLCRRTKRNPALVGPAGVGKTAIIEGLAQRIVRGDVPEVLHGVRVFAVQPSVLVAGASRVGELEARMKALLTEASQDGVLLFIDEVHSIIGAGGMVGVGDVASLLKPALARGDLACIAATTDDEYRRFIEPDAALERRFQPIRVQELTVEQTLSVLSAHRDDLAQTRRITVGDEVLRHLVEFGQQYLRNRYFPDKAVDLLEQCIAYAMTQGKSTVNQQDAESVAQRMVGMPLAVADRLTSLREQLTERSLLTEADTGVLLNRLEVTMRGLDMRPGRPNAVVLLIGEAAASAEALAETVAETLFGSSERQVAIDLSRFLDREHITMLIGAPPGYVGYTESLPVHRIAQTPWSVLRLQNAHACHAHVRSVLAQALTDGFLTDARGRRIYLSDTVVLATAEVPTDDVIRTIGFRYADDLPPSGPRLNIATALGTEFASQIDLVCWEVPSSDSARRRWIEASLLPHLSAQYRKQGLDLRWDASFVDWLADRPLSSKQRDLEHLVDQHLTPLLVPYFTAPETGRTAVLLVKSERGTVKIACEIPDETEEG